MPKSKDKIIMGDVEHKQSDTAISALVDTIIDSKDFIAELGDVALDAAIVSSVLEKVPVLS